MAVVGYSNGLLRVISLGMEPNQNQSSTSEADVGQQRQRLRPVITVLVDIAAHARCINGLSLSLDSRVGLLLASCAEDHQLRVWNLKSAGRDKDRSEIEVRLLSSEKMDSKLLTGVVFLPDGRIGAVAYDEDYLFIFKEPLS
jgi:WD40 repeat protein